MLKLMLDENISPALDKPLWEMQVDTTSTRDRGMLMAGDHKVWKRAQSEDRSVVTINAGDFESLARQTPRHSGLVIIPSGQGRAGQLKLITSVIESVRAENAILPSLRGRVFKVAEDGQISIEMTPEPEPQTRPILRVVS